MKRIILLTISLYLVFIGLSAREWTVKDVPDVQRENRTAFVSNPDDILSPETVASINNRLTQFRDTTTCEVAVVVLESIGDNDIFDFAQELAETWGIGKKDLSNGVLFLVVMDQHKARIHSGYGTEEALTDATASLILQNKLTPAMREGDTDKAVTQTVEAITSQLTDPRYAESLKSSQTEEELAIDPEALWVMCQYVAAIMFILALASFIWDCRSSRRKDHYLKSMIWRRHLWLYLILGILSMGAGLVFALLALFLYRANRTARLKCPSCGHKMKRLSESEDNKALTPAQNLEEQLKTIDWDVWECPSCGALEMRPYPSRQTKYTQCPKCHTVSFHLKSDRVVVRPTPRSAGVGVKVYECKNCGYTKEEKYKIPPTNDNNTGTVIAAGLAAGALRGGGGGFSGGNFGGGGFGGGGATGSW